MSNFYPYTLEAHLAHSDEKKNDGVVMMTDCERCWDEIYQALGEEETLKLADSLPDLLERVNKSLMRDDAQPFVRVRNLGGTEVKVWHRLFAGDFMAEAHVRRKEAKRSHRLTATGEGLGEALESLATAVADYLNPVEAQR